MPSLRRMSGREVIAAFRSFGFEVVGQKGSHIKLRRISNSGRRETLTIPDHRELDTGTLRAILRQASSYISMRELEKYFFN